MTPFFALYTEAFTWLRRDKIFGPVLLAGFAISWFASTASQWVLEDMQKVLFDIGLAGFRMTGGLVAILWGARMVHDALSERSLDPRLAAPVGRHTWYLARYAALATVLVIMGLAFAGWWQLVMTYNNYGLITKVQSLALALQLCEWLVIAALTMMLSVFTGYGLAMFSAGVFWVVGLVAPLVAASKDPQNPATQSVVVDLVADFWNFQRFNLIDQIRFTGGQADLADLSTRLIWAAALLVALLTAGVWRFSERDLG